VNWWNWEWGRRRRGEEELEKLVELGVRTGGGNGELVELGRKGGE
jgi:hypothetical protein